MSLSIHSGTNRVSVETDKLQVGDPREIQKLFELYYHSFVEEAGQLLVDKNKAPELVRHCFIKLWLKCNVLNSRQYFAFLRTSVNTHCYNANNSKRYFPGQEDILNDIIFGLAREGRQSIYEEISAHSPEQKARACEVFEKLYVRELPLSVIATEMCLSDKETREALNLAYKTLHLIISFQPI